MTIPDFKSAYKGRFFSILRWHQLDDLWAVIQQHSTTESWYIYAVGQGVPETVVTTDELLEFIQKIDTLLHQEHEEDYCGIVYADNPEHPTFIKIFDPNNLGVTCGYSDNPPPPGWILSQIKPVDLETNELITGSRKRWWQKIWKK